MALAELLIILIYLHHAVAQEEFFPNVESPFGDARLTAERGGPPIGAAFETIKVINIPNNQPPFSTRPTSRPLLGRPPPPPLSQPTLPQKRKPRPIAPQPLPIPVTSSQGIPQRPQVSGNIPDRPPGLTAVTPMTEIKPEPETTLPPRRKPRPIAPQPLPIPVTSNQGIPQRPQVSGNIPDRPPGLTAVTLMTEIKPEPETTLPPRRKPRPIAPQPLPIPVPSSQGIPQGPQVSGNIPQRPPGLTAITPMTEIIPEPETVATTLPPPPTTTPNTVDSLPAYYQRFIQNKDGSYYFDFAAPNGVQRLEQGFFKRDDFLEFPILVKTGAYSFVSPEDILFRVDYVADERGYRAFSSSKKFNRKFVLRTSDNS